MPPMIKNTNSHRVGFLEVNAAGVCGEQNRHSRPLPLRAIDFNVAAMLDDDTPRAK